MTFTRKMNAKGFLLSWVQKANLTTPTFDMRTSGRKHSQRFLCEVRVDGFPYIGLGNSTNKKYAQFNAVRDFVLYLVREKFLKESDIPVESGILPSKTSLQVSIEIPRY